MGSESNWSGQLEGGIAGRGLELEECMELMVTFEGGKAVGNARDLNSWSMVYQHQYTLLRSWVLLGLDKITPSVSIRSSAP